MYTAKIQNANGQVLTLTENENDYQVLSIIGLNPSPALINTSPIVGMDGALFNSSRLETRNIVITLKINGDAEANRMRLYNYFRTKEWCRFYYITPSRNVYIDGYVETLECDLFAESEEAQISIICPSTYFVDMSESSDVISSTVSLFVFPFSIEYDEPIPFSGHIDDMETSVYNSSESEVGAKFVLQFSGNVNEVDIRNVDTGEDLTLDYAFEALDVVTINTIKGQKSITLLRNGITTNIFSSLKKGSTFIQLHAGANPLSYVADGGASNDNVTITVYHSNVYRGV